MNWKKVLMFDLRSLTNRADKTSRESRIAEDLWFVRLCRFFAYGRSGKSHYTRGFELESGFCTPGRNYDYLSPAWPGPVYLPGKRRLIDLHYVVEQLGGMVRTNAPLASGLDSLVRVERRSSRGFGGGNAFFQAMAVAAGVLFSVAVVGYVCLSLKVSLLTTMAAISTPLIIVALLRLRTRTLSRNLFIVLILAVAATVGALFVLDGLHWTYQANAAHRARTAWLSLDNSLHLAEFHFYRYLMRNADSVVATFLFCASAGLFVWAMQVARSGGPRELVLARLRDRIANGVSLSQAMRELHRFFPRFYADMVEAGEETGQLAECLGELSVAAQSTMQRRQHIRSTLVYLCVVGGFMTLISIFIAIRVVPVFYEIHQEFGYKSESSLVASVCQWPTDLVRERWRQAGMLRFDIGVVLAVAVIGGFFFRFLLIHKGQRGVFSHSLSSLFLVVPGFRGLVVNSNFAVIALMLEKLLRAGVPLDRALSKTAAGDLNPLYAGMLLRVHGRVLQGEGFTEAFQAESSPLIAPASFVGLASAGESAGMLPDALAYLKTFYSARANMRARILVDVIKPFGVVFLGLITMAFMVHFFRLFVGIAEAILNSI